MIQWRKRIGFVSQDNYLFHDTIINNIKIANPNVTRNIIIECSKRARAHNFINKLPEGYDTVVGDRGITLSGGQRQRIAIARAMVRDPEIYVFDEATSALDRETEKHLIDDIHKLFKNKTVIIISHNLLTIKGAQKILQIHNTKVNEISNKRLNMIS